MSETRLTYRGFPLHTNSAKPAWLYCPGLKRHIRIHAQWRAEIGHDANRAGELVIYRTGATAGEEPIELVRLYPPAACGAAPFNDADTWLESHVTAAASPAQQPGHSPTPRTY
jgi:hypothetical protein